MTRALSEEEIEAHYQARLHEIDRLEAVGLVAIYATAIAVAMLVFVIGLRACT